MLLVAGGIATGVAIAVAADPPPGVIGPINATQPTGRQLHPVGKQTRLGNFPTGGALTTNGRFLWTLSTGRGRNDIRIVRVLPDSCKKPKKKGGKKGAAASAATPKQRAQAKRKASKCKRKKERRVGEVVQTIPMPGLSGGIAMAPDGRTAYVSGVPDSGHADQKVDASVPGRNGDVVHVFTYNRGTGIADRNGVIPVPPPAGAPAYQDFPPSATAKRSWPRDIAVSPDGRTLLVALNLADYAAIVDTATRSVRYAAAGHYPYGAAISRDGKRGLITSETEGKVTVIDLATGAFAGDVQVAPRLSHPEGMATDPKSDRVFVANANQDTIAVINTQTYKVDKMLSVARSEGVGTFPTYLSVTPDGCDLLSADSGEDAVAVFAISTAKRCVATAKAKKKKKKGKPAAADAKKNKKKKKKKRGAPVHEYDLLGRIPTGSYPTAVAATPKRGRLAWVSARGLGVGPNPNGPNPKSPANNDNAINQFQYLPSIVSGSSGVLPFPTLSRLRKLTPVADQEIVPTNTRAAPADTPIRANGPIKHVFYIVRENRTYDQVLGDEPRGDGDPNLELFNSTVTPNAHALVQRFPLLDHVYANSEASIDGHYWTAAGAVSDYVTKNWHQNYAHRGRPYDFGSYDVSRPPAGYIFERALDEGVSFYNYGEGLAGLSPFPDKDRTPEESARNLALLQPNLTDVQLNGGCYDGDISIFDSPPIGPKTAKVYDSTLPPGAPPTDHSRFTCFNNHFQVQLGSDTVPAFNYIVLPLDHTEGVTPGKRTPDADVASNDWGLGQIVDTISHSSIWDESLILVVEDDSQDGADHVDAHRIPALVISPYTQQGAVVHDRFDQLSFLRTLEIVAGMKPLNLAEALAVPLYNALTANPDNIAPYNAIMPSVDMNAVNPMTRANREASAGLPLNALDQIPQRRLDSILWHYRHGFGSSPPPPGPNAAGNDRLGEDEDEDPLSRPGALARELMRMLRGKPPAQDPDGDG
jgi:DNA-binding beta-propeller fold protein YncE